MADRYYPSQELRGDTSISTGTSPANVGGNAQPAGTKYISFGENATSGAFNRAINSVQENVDRVYNDLYAELAMPQVIDVSAMFSDALAGGDLELALPAVYRVYVQGDSPPPATLVGDDSELIVGSNGTLAVTGAKLGSTDLTGGANVAIQAANTVTAMTANSITFQNNWDATGNNRIPSVGDIVVRAGGSNNTAAGQNWCVSEVTSANSIRVYKKEDPSQALVTTAPLGTGTLQTNGYYCNNPTLVFNFNPFATLANGGAGKNSATDKIYLHIGTSRQTIPTGSNYPLRRVSPWALDALIANSVKSTAAADVSVDPPAQEFRGSVNAQVMGKAKALEYDSVVEANHLSVINEPIGGFKVKSNAKLEVRAGAFVVIQPVTEILSAALSNHWAAE